LPEEEVAAEVVNREPPLDLAEEPIPRRVEHARIDLDRTCCRVDDRYRYGIAVRIEDAGARWVEIGGNGHVAESLHRGLLLLLLEEPILGVGGQGSSSSAAACASRRSTSTSSASTTSGESGLLAVAVTLAGGSRRLGRRSRRERRSAFRAAGRGRCSRSRRDGSCV
jgi:hypothetical protein